MRTTAPVAPARPADHPLLHRGDVLAMALGAALLSCTSIFVVLAQVAPGVSAFYRMLFGGTALFGWVVLRGRWQPIRGRDAALALLPALGLATDLILWHRSILWVGPGVATLLTNFQVFLLAVVGVVAYRERLAPAFWPGMALALAGLWLLVGAHWSLFDVEHRLGVWLGLASCLAYTVYLLSFRRALAGRSALPPAQFLGLMSLLCAGVLALWCVADGESLALTTVRGWLSLLALGLLGQVVAWLLIGSAMPRLPASLVGLLLLLQPALAFVVDVLLFGRPTSAMDWLGLLLALAGILLGALRRRRPLPPPASG
ncbi:DMT family transporter [Dyella ginsengisoli]|uniref:DMT family transporter n=1 Tax=Dyella ginsengisoli TaxID=363848 RepID=UPI0003448DF4|nr:DMT family transporter [Dyella ginsengisoli]